VCVLTRDAAIQVLSTVTCAPITRTIRGIRSEVPVGPEEGLPGPGVISCDTIVTIPKTMVEQAVVGHLGPVQRAALDRAVRYSLDIRY
jgi:mRNA interferase MazF